MKEKNNKEIVYLLVCLVVVTLIYLLNHFTLYTSDDFVYRFIYKEPFPSANEQPVRSLFDLITSQMNHWKVWNGRFTGHSIVQIFMQYNKEVFNVFNSSVFLSLGILIDSLSFEIVSNKHRKHQVLYLAIIFLILWWFLPEIGKTVLWISGSGNYLWTAVLDLLWLKVVLRRNQSPYNILWTIP
ncbi:transporter, partial [Streptococcus thermophilus]|nr:transporter [Streptococcus thermophilus]